METSYLNYYKTVLSKVSFDHDLLVKEYQKAMSLLGSEEARELLDWLTKNNLSPEFNVIETEISD